MKKQENRLFAVSLAILILVITFSSRQLLAAEYNFYFYEDPDKKSDRSATTQFQTQEKTPPLETSALKTNENEPSPQEEIVTKSAAMVTPPPTLIPLRFLPILLPFLPDDAYLSAGWEFNDYHDNKRSTSDSAQSLSIRLKMSRLLALESSIPLTFYNAGLRIFKFGMSGEWEGSGYTLKEKIDDSQYARRWKRLGNGILRLVPPLALHLSSGIVYNSRWENKDLFVRTEKIRTTWKNGFAESFTMKEYWEEDAFSGMSKINLYLGSGFRFRLFNHIDLTASLNFMPSRKWSRLFSTGASVVF